MKNSTNGCCAICLGQVGMNKGECLTPDCAYCHRATQETVEGGTRCNCEYPNTRAGYSCPHVFQEVFDDFYSTPPTEEWESTIDGICTSWDDEYDLGKKEIKQLIKSLLSRQRTADREWLRKAVGAMECSTTLTDEILKEAAELGYRRAQLNFFALLDKQV